MRKELLRPNIRSLIPYSSARSEHKGQRSISLDANESPFPQEMDLNRYPDPLQSDLKCEISRLLGVEERGIFLGNGSDEAIDLLVRALVEPKEDYVVICPPTYGLYRVLTEIQGGSVLEVPLTADFSLDIPALEMASSAKSKLLFICSPNNPTGNAFPRSEIEKAIQNFPGIVVVDEAYADFAEENSILDLIHKYESLYVLRTFSKAFGMAGIRLGFLIGSPDLIEVLNSIKYPYNINTLTANKALETLKSIERIRANTRSICLERERFAKELKKVSEVEYVYPSDANFLLVRVKDAVRTVAFLKQCGVVVRDRSNEPGCDNCVRITVGTFEENQFLLSKMEEVI